MGSRETGSPLFGLKGESMEEIKIGGRVVPLYYSTFEMVAIQEEIGCTAFQLKDEVFGLKVEDADAGGQDVRLDIARDAAKMRKLGTLIRILGNAGLEENGEAGDLTDKWVLRHIKPAMILIYAIVLMKVISDGNMMEAGDDENGPVDETLEEQNAKKQPGN